MTNPRTENRGRSRARWGAVCSGFGLVLVLVGCGGPDLDVRSYPPDIQSAYSLFRTRCSKCHSIARPLNAGVEEPTHWDRYVARMRRMPGSGISPRDGRIILRFLHYYQAKKFGRLEEGSNE